MRQESLAPQGRFRLHSRAQGRQKCPPISLLSSKLEGSYHCQRSKSSLGCEGLTCSWEHQYWFLTDQGQVGQFSQTLSFVQDSLPLVVDGIRTIAGLAAQLDVAALQQFAIHPAPGLGRFNWRSRWESDTINRNATLLLTVVSAEKVPDVSVLELAKCQD